MELVKHSKDVDVEENMEDFDDILAKQAELPKNSIDS